MIRDFEMCLVGDRPLNTKLYMEGTTSADDELHVDLVPGNHRGTVSFGVPGTWVHLLLADISQLGVQSASVLLKHWTCALSALSVDTPHLFHLRNNEGVHLDTICVAMGSESACCKPHVVATGIAQIDRRGMGKLRPY